MLKVKTSLEGKGKTLVTWMSNRGYKYLVVVYTHGRGTSIAELKPIFSNKRLRTLTADF
jgi:hypothetical protein